MNYVKGLLISIIAVLAPVKAVILSTLFLVTADMILGILAARKRGESITSFGFRRSIVKLLVYEAVIILGFVTEQYLTGDFLPISKIISAFIGLTELKSVMENLNEISGGSLLKALLDRLQNAKIDEIK